MSAEAIWVLAERPSGEHIAQLYSHETVLIESLRMFTTRGLSRGEAVLLVLTPSHRGLLLQHLKADGVDVDALQRAGQLLLLDAAELPGLNAALVFLKLIYDDDNTSIYQLPLTISIGEAAGTLRADSHSGSVAVARFRQSDVFPTASLCLQGRRGRVR